MSKKIFLFHLQFYTIRFCTVGGHVTHLRHQEKSPTDVVHCKQGHSNEGFEGKASLYPPSSCIRAVYT